MIRVAVSGAAGRMGSEVVKTVLSQPDMQLVGACDTGKSGVDVGEIIRSERTGVIIEKDLKKMLESTKPDVVVDFTTPHAVFENVMTVIERAHCVVGTTGLTESQLKELEKKALSTGFNAVVCPNFAIGAVLMMQFAKIAARYLNAVEIIELHHDKKLDAPSGTAIQTAKLISEAAERRTEISGVESKEIYEGARGAEVNGIRVHSVRLPGLVAHQEVIFGGEGQILTIRHDSIDRSSFMPGVMIAIRKVSGRKGLTVGLEHLLEV